MQFEIEGKKYVRIADLGIRDWRRIASYCQELGYADLNELLDVGGERLFDAEKSSELTPYLFTALFYHREDITVAASFEPVAIRDRAEIFCKKDLPPEIVGGLISFFFEKIIALSRSSPETLYRLMKMSQKPEKKSAAPTPKGKSRSTGKSSSRKSQSKRPAETPMSLIHSKEKTSGSN